MKTVEVRVHNTPEPILLRLVIPQRRMGAKTKAENFGPKSHPLLSGVLAIHLEVRETQACGRPHATTPEQVTELLPLGGATYGEWMRAALAAGLTRSTFKRSRQRCLDLGFVCIDRDLYFVAPGPKPDAIA